MTRRRGITHRKRRIRKKWRVQEFIEYGFEVSGTFGPGKFTMDWLDAAIDFAESHRLGFGGGGNRDSFSLFVTSLDGKSLTDDHRMLVLGWFVDHGFPDTEVGKLTDAWG